MSEKTAVIIGAGPAGLTAAYELLHHAGIRPVVLEAAAQVGGLSRTVDYKGNRIDIGGHRFFSGSRRINDWWLDILPLQGAPARDDRELGRAVAVSRKPGAPDPEVSDRVMLLRPRVSRIFAFRKFFSYPIRLSRETVMNLGVARIFRIMASYIKTRLFPRKEERTLQDFLINRFGEELYRTFFKSYTEKVWGVRSEEIGADWGAQRIRGLSVARTIAHAWRRMFRPRSCSASQDGTEISLIEQFMYPKLGPGQLWEDVARIIREKGGEIHLCSEVVGVKHADRKVTQVSVRDTRTGQVRILGGDYFISTMPVKDLVQGLDPAAPSEVDAVARQLVYRDFIMIGLVLKDLKIRNRTRHRTVHGSIPDNWIYVQEKDVLMARIQIFNNWSPYLVKDDKTLWTGLEYFCNEGDALWSRTDDALVALGVDELVRIGFIDGRDAVLDAVVLRVPKAYPSYCGAYDRFDTLRTYADSLENLFLVGRNGMHRYNNTDHSMLTAMKAVENIMSGKTGKDNIWAVNRDKDYQEKI